MDIFSVITLIGGLTFFLFGMNVMSENLEKLAGGQLEHLLKKMTAHPFLSVFVGAIITIAMQSSSATTVLLVGLVNSGILSFAQSISVIFGANIGTTLTAWILSLSGIESSSVWVQMLKPINFSPFLALLGVVLLMFCKKGRQHNIGKALLGFAVLMYGMTMMADAVKPLAEDPAFGEMLVKFKNPILGLLIALVITAVIQSSAASIGILQALALSLASTGVLTYEIVIPMVMGLNIGTCATAMISCIGTGTNAKRVATAHLSIKVLGAAICLPLFLILNSIFDWSFINEAATPIGIAIVHTVYNLLVTALFLPFSKPLVKLAEFLVKDKKKGGKVLDKDLELDERLIRSPSLAVAECEIVTVRMSEIAYGALKKAFSIIYNYNAGDAEWVLGEEDKLDRLEDHLGTYLVKLSSQSLTQQDSRAVSKMLHTIGDFERLGDHAVNLLKVSEEIHRKSITFSPSAMKELEVLLAAVEEILDMTEAAFQKNDMENASNVEPLEQVIDDLIDKIKDNHIDRLKNGFCTIELGFVLSDLMTNMERISDHCSNVAVAVIETAHDSFDTHKYLNEVKDEDETFKEKYQGYKGKYQLEA